MKQKNASSPNKPITTNKMKAFSLVETIAVMLLSAFLLLFAWKGVQYVQQLTLQEQKLMSKVESEMLFRYRIHKDFASGMRFLQQQKNGFSLYHHYTKDTVSYFMTAENIIRKEKKQVDTFEIPIKELYLNPHTCQMRIGEQNNLLQLQILPFATCD